MLLPSYHPNSRDAFAPKNSRDATSRVNSSDATRNLPTSRDAFAPKNSPLAIFRLAEVSLLSRPFLDALTDDFVCSDAQLSCT